MSASDRAQTHQPGRPHMSITAVLNISGQGGPRPDSVLRLLRKVARHLR